MSMLLQYEMLSSQKEDLLAGGETIRSTVRQLEAQNQELQRHIASLDKDLMAERAMKEQKIKVEIKRHGYTLFNSVHLLAPVPSLSVFISRFIPF